MITGKQKSLKMENQTPSGPQNVGRKVGRQHYGRTATLDKIQDILPEERVSFANLSSIMLTQTILHLLNWIRRELCSI
jgi:hypothetical protein